MNRAFTVKLKLFLVGLLIAGIAAVSSPIAQAQTAPTDGMKVNTPAVHAFTNATIVTSPGQTISNGTLVIRDGVIEAVGRNVNVPADARVWDMEGKTLYPGFIDAHSDVGMKDPRVELDRGSLAWNPQLRAHLSAENEYDLEDDGSDALRAAGFTTALSVPPLGIFQGQAAVVNLGNGPVSDRVVRTGVAHGVRLMRSFEFGFTYPTSPIGAIALIRQTLYDADWYDRAHSAFSSNPSGLQRPESNAVLASLRDAVNGNQPLLFETGSDEEILRALRFKNEFSITPWILGSGHEYKVADYLSENPVPIILPLAFPDTPDIKTQEDALNEDLADLRHWYLAPENPARLDNAGLEFSFTTKGIDNKTDFLSNLRDAIHAGLNRNSALAALTTHPASLLGIESTHGSLEPGKAANFVVASGDLFEDQTRILDVWVDGNHFSINKEDAFNAKGEWQITSADGSFDGVLNITESRPGRLGGTVTIGDEEIDLASATVHQESRRVRAEFAGDQLDVHGKVRLTASISGDRLFGWAEMPGHARKQWSAERLSTTESDERESRERKLRDLNLVDLRPAMEYGRERIPEQPGAVLVQNATVWTMGPQGVLENADLLIRNGEVAEVGRNLSAPRNAVVIDAEGKHVTPGLIDAHIHSGVNGVNEIGNAITAEVRMGDVLDINNIWMYRQLAGGLTAAHVMHGSANPIGGQNVHIKMRWGALSHDLIIDDAPRTVKFALGENPKRVGSDRYPDTRMGVEQIIADRFSMARDYEARWNAWEQNQTGIPPRRDIRLDAVRDILNGDILVQSHSYRQDEILMLMRLAEDYDFRIKAFHHGVEAYKVAPELAEHGAGAVVWSDWGGFKIEAYDNTNYNARLLHEAGVVTSLHSDNSQIASRMNWEAAKMVRVGVDPETALSMVTSSTAKLLGIDHRVGSLEPGKDADFVIWNGDPLSTFTKAEQTWIDGRKYFDLEEHAELEQAIEEERAKLIQWIMEAEND
ncbi:MAG: amidohydrolase family protein [Balneolaceae bacterium]|nr:amidohydrolase family protein [Balneolaceae bacterium]